MGEEAFQLAEHLIGGALTIDPRQEANLRLDDARGTGSNQKVTFIAFLFAGRITAPLAGARALNNPLPDGNAG